jgi:hypothetical protein
MLAMLPAVLAGYNVGSAKNVAVYWGMWLWSCCSADSIG